MKKVLSLVLCLGLLAGVVGCSSEADKAKEDKKEEKKTSSKTEKKDKDTLTISDVQKQMDKAFENFNGNYRYDWGDNKEYHLLFEFYDNKTLNSATFSKDGVDKIVAYYYNNNLIGTGVCKLNYDTMTAQEGSECTDADINDVSGMEKIVEKALGYVDLTIKDLQEAN